MKKITMPLMLASFAFLGACGEAAEEPQVADPTSIDDQVSDAPMPVEPDGGIGGDAITDPEVMQGRIPARFHGVWDYEGGTCAPESDLRMEIAAREITFYESYGAVSGVGQEGDDVTPVLVMEGEGESWISPLRLSLVDTPDGVRLHTSDATEPKEPDPLPRMKCE